MLFTVPLLSKGSFLGSLINKCRQVVRIKPVKKIETNIESNISTSLKTTTPIQSINITCTPTTPATSEQQKIRPIAAANLCLSSTSNAVKTLEEKVGMPPKPKKPLTPFFRYLVEQRPKLRAANPKLPLMKVVQEVSKQWYALDISVKKRLEEEFQRDKQKYVDVRLKYDSKITDEQRSQLKELKREISDAKERRMMRKRIKQLGRPKRPASAFLRFLSKERTNTPQMPKESYREWHQKMTAKWATFSEEEKSVYISETQKELEKYRNEVSLWEEQMVRLGHIDVIRHVSLIDPPEPKPRKRQ